MVAGAGGGRAGAEGEFLFKGMKVYPLLLFFFFLLLDISRFLYLYVYI